MLDREENRTPGMDRRSPQITLLVQALTVVPIVKNSVLQVRKKYMCRIFI